MSRENIKAHYLLDAATTQGDVSDGHQNSNNGSPETTYQAFGTTSSGAGTAVVDIEVSNDNKHWITGGTISLTLATTVSTDGIALSSAWKYSRANLSTLTGTGASVTVIMGD